MKIVNFIKRHEAIVNIFLVVCIFIVLFAIVNPNIITRVSVMKARQGEARFVLARLYENREDIGDSSMQKVIAGGEMTDGVPLGNLFYTYCSGVKNCSKPVGEDDARKIKPYMEKNGAPFFAFSNLDDEDEELDVWMVSQSGEVIHLNDDIVWWRSMIGY